jgi:hypothetical protein
MTYFVSYLGTEIEVTVDDTGLNIPVFTPSYWTQEVLETIASLPREERPDPLPPPPQPDWEGFLTPFYLPDMSSSPYNSIERKVQEAWVIATKLPTEAERDASLHGAMSLRTHWYNCSLGLTNPSIRSPVWLTRTWNDLKALMELNQVPLSESEVQVIEDLFKQHHLM